MKSLFAVLGLIATISTAQTNVTTDKPAFIRGTMDIKFNTRNGSGKTDIYNLSINVCNSALFHGTVTARASSTGYVHDAFGAVEYNLDCDLVNPRNPSQLVNIGRIVGSVPVNLQNQYLFTDGNVTCSILQRGSARAFDSKFSGLAIGKPPKAKAGVWARLKKQTQEAVTFNRKVNGKVLSVTLKNYDKMEFQNHVLAAGPVQTYPEAVVNGVLYYDYDPRNTWFFRDIHVTYTDGSVQRMDTLSGTVRWIEDRDRKSSGLGHYEFDIRYNEPVATEGAAFDANQDESAFFETDNNVPSLTGTMSYKDAFSGDTVVASAVQFDLVGNKLTKQQAMYTAKLILLSAIVPWNAE